MTTKPADEAMREAARSLRDEYSGSVACDYPVCIGGECSHECERDEKYVESFCEPLLAALRALDAAGWSIASQEILTAIRMQVVASTAGSCSCGMKSPNAALHPADCRYAQLAGVLDNLDTLAAAAPKLPGVGDG